MKQQFDHEGLRVYGSAIGFIAWLENLPISVEYRVSATDHLTRASASVPVNIAEASAKRTPNARRQFIDTARGSALECAACLDVLGVLGHLSGQEISKGKERLSVMVSMLIGLRKVPGLEVHESLAEYGSPLPKEDTIWFDHERLRVYRRSLEFVDWCGRHRRARGTVGTALDKSSTCITLNIAEGNGKYSSKDRCRFIEHARTAALQAAATLDVLVARNPCAGSDASIGKAMLAETVRMLVAWERSLKER